MVNKSKILSDLSKIAVDAMSTYTILKKAQKKPSVRKKKTIKKKKKAKN